MELPIFNDAIKGEFQLNAVISAPGKFSFPLGIALKIYDICDDSYFANAPVLSPNNQYYYTGQGDLVVEASYLQDFISRTTNTVCGTYSIVAVLNSAATKITVGVINP